jgi:hypothetical protein
MSAVAHQLGDLHAIALKAASRKERNDPERDAHVLMNRPASQKMQASRAFII